MYKWNEEELRIGIQCVHKVQFIEDKVVPREHKIYPKAGELSGLTPLLLPLVNGMIPPEEEARLAAWERDLDDNDPTKAVHRKQDYTAGGRLYPPGDIRSYGLTEKKRTTATNKTWPEREPNLVVQPPPWTGLTITAEFTFDYSQMKPRTINSTDSALTAYIHHGLLQFDTQTRKQTIDTRIAAAITTGHIREHLATIQEEISNATAAKAWPCWQITTALQQIQDAQQLIGFPTAGADPSYPYICTDNIKLPCHTRYDPHRASVAFMDGLHQWDILGDDIQADTRLIMITTHRTKQHIFQKITQLKAKKIGTIQASTKGAISYKSITSAQYQNISLGRKMTLWITGATQDEQIESKDALLRIAWTQTDLQREELSHHRWGEYHGAAQDISHRHRQGIRIGTDGSLQENQDLRGDSTTAMGAGIAYAPLILNQQEFSHELQDTALQVEGAASTLVAEGAAMIRALRDPPKDIELLISTDSHNVMSIMESCTLKEYWKDYSTHKNMEMIKELCEEMHTRIAPTHLLKVKSHSGVGINEKADKLAAAGCAAEERTLYRTQESKAITIRRQGEPGTQTTTLREIYEHKRYAALITDTETRKTMTIPDTARASFAKYIHQGGSTDKTARLMIQCITNTYPTQQRLHQMGIASSPQCRCGQGPETLHHMTQTCRLLKDATTKAHNNIWQAVWKEIQEELTKEWTTYTETTIKDTVLRSSAANSVRRPDGIAHNTTTKEWILLDFTRCGATDMKGIEDAERRKLVSYQPLLMDLTIRNSSTVKFFPLVATNSAAVQERTWIKCLDALGIEQKQQKRILDVAVGHICEAFTFLVDARMTSIREQPMPQVTNRNSNASHGEP